MEKLNASNTISNAEKVEYSATFKKGAYLKNLIIPNLVYTLLWIAFDVFFIYLLVKDALAGNLWFVTIPVVGLNLLRLWTLLFKIIKEIEEQKDISYVLTDKAVYMINDGKYKEAKRIAYADIFVAEKSDYFCDGIYVATLTKTIKICNTGKEQEMLTKIASKIAENFKDSE